MRSRLQKLFGATYPFVLRPQLSAGTCFVLWLSSLPLTWHHPWLALLGFVSIWCLTVALSLEVPLLQSLPLPPLTVLLVGLCLRWGIGPLLLALSGSGGDPLVDIWIRYGPQAQLLWLVFTAFLILFAFPLRHRIALSSRCLPSSSWLIEANSSNQFRRKLVSLAWILSLYMGFYLFLSILSGAFDRQFDTYIAWSQQLWRLDTPVAAFSRLRDIWFLFFPLWWFVLGRYGRLVLVVELSIFVASALLSGSRGLLFYPALLLLSGLWFVLTDPRIIRVIFLFLVIAFLALSPLIFVVRQSPSFQTAGTFMERIQSVGTVMSRPDLLYVKARGLGRDLYACHDPYLFTPENRDEPPARFKGLSALLYLWVPKHLYPDRPVVFDGHIIAKRLQRVVPSEWSKVWYPCLSLPADLFRRWSLTGLLLGSLIAAFIVHLLLRLWYSFVTVNNGTYHLLLMSLPATYIQSFPFGTVSETAWSLLWELPKYLLLFWMIGVVVDRYLSRPGS